MRKPVIRSSFEHKGTIYMVEWYDTDSIEDLPAGNWNQVYGLCFYDDRVVLVTYENDRDNLPGGSIEQGESFAETFIREIKEETNMRVLDYRPLGFQIIEAPNGDKIYQLRMVAKVEPIGEFKGDPAGAVTGYKLVAPEKVNTHIQYGDIGGYMIHRAIGIHKDM